MFRIVAGEGFCTPMKAKSRIIKLKGWLASVFTFNTLIYKYFF